MKDLKIPTEVINALDKLDNLIEHSKSVPLKDGCIMIDKNELREIHTIISREKNRIKEIRCECLNNANEEANLIIQKAKIKGNKILEDILNENIDINDANIKAALLIKENSIEYVENVLTKLSCILSNLDSYKDELLDNIKEIKKDAK